MEKLIEGYKANYRRIEKAWAYFDREDISYEDKEKHYESYVELLREQGVLQWRLKQQGVDIDRLIDESREMIA